MKILILGAGVIGVTNAYFLKKSGHDVTVIDRQPESGHECSYANGGQLSYCHAEPWATPKAMRKAIKWIGQKDAPLYFRWRVDPAMWKWGLQFLLNCRKSKVRDTTEAMLRLMLYSRKIMHELQDELNLEFDYLQNGILHVFYDEHLLDCEIRQSDFQVNLGASYKRLTPEQCLEKEPALKHRADDLVGGVYYPMDESGDIFAFTRGLEEKCQEMGVEFLFDTEISELNRSGDRIISVETSNGSMSADMYVMALGAYSPVYMKQIGIKLPIYPMKGYSISVPIENHEAAPQISITDQNEKIVYTTLGGVLRVAGTAEFAGYDHSVTQYRTELLKEAVKRNFPDCGDVEKATEWACLRPSTPDCPPILGRTQYDNLILNTGHGTLGWSQGAGSARIVADIIDGKYPKISLAGLTLDRF